MDIKIVYQSVETESDPNLKRRHIVDYLKSCVPVLENSPELRSAAAYDIASLLSTSYSRSLKENDPIDIVLVSAGELETTDPNNSKWAAFIDSIESLE